VEERRPGLSRIDVYGSLDELERDFGVRPADLHRPVIDELRVSDRIDLAIAGPPDVVAAVDRHRTWLAEQVLAASVDQAAADSPPPSPASGPAPWQADQLPDGRALWLRIRRSG
jgi:hypothetical protein